MKVAVIGSRDFEDFSKVTIVLDELVEITHIISGGAKGTEHSLKIAESLGKEIRRITINTETVEV